MATSSDSTVILIDGSSFLFRAFHALPPLTNSKGLPTGAILGVANMLRKMLVSYTSPYFIVIFDAPGQTFRDELYADYKANRPPIAEDLKAQITPLHDLIRAMGLPLVMETGVEADDVIGTLAKLATEAGHSVIISSGDKDMAQLVNAQVSIENTMSDTRMDSQGVFDKFGVHPHQIIDYLALMGDSADNIPGVPKVGPKTASKWLKEYGSIEKLIECADQIKGKVGENLRANLDQIPLSQQLTTIKCDVPLNFGIEDLKKTECNIDHLRSLLQQHEFSSWLRQLSETDATQTLAEDPAENQVEKIPSNYEMICSEAHLQRWIEQLSKAKLFAFDTETTSLDYASAEIVGLSFSTEAGKAAYVPVGHDYLGVPQQLDREWVFNQLAPLLEDAGVKKLGQNLKYDANVLANHNVQLRGIVHDTMLESYVLNSTATRHNMDALAKKYLNIETIHYEDVAGKGSKQIPFQQVPLEQAAPYAAEDADITLRLHHKIWPQLQKFTQLTVLYREIEIPLVAVLSRMEQNGVLVNAEMLSMQSQELATNMARLEERAFELAGHEFNLGSPKQIQQILYDELELPVLKKTPKGQPSTAEAVLQELALDYPLPQVILQHRSMSKLKSTYTDRLPEQINPATGRVHTSYHQAVAATGRLSSSDPNLQNIPIKSAEGRRIRQAFVAEKDHCLLAADYSQIELRIMAHLSGDKNLLGAFSDNLDVHQATAAEVFGLSLDDVSSEQRRSAKAINFGLIYGMSAFGLGRQLGIPRGEAQSYIDSYFNRYPGVRDYMDSIKDLARKQGYVETLFGRRLYLPEINARNAQRRQYAERTAINAPMQGTAADIIKKAMIATDKWIFESPKPIKMIMQVHDELVFEIDNNFVASAKKEIRRLMEQAANLDVPLYVDIGCGVNWDQAH